MSEWAAKRFWEQATTIPVEGGFTVALDGRHVKTPAKSPLVFPSLALANAAAEEWQAQDTAINPNTMPITRSANAAIDKVAVQFKEVADMLADYGDSDLTCYRAAAPVGLVAAQAAAWDPLLEWAAETYSAQLIPVEGVVHFAQPDDALAKLQAPLYRMSPFELTAMHDLVSISGSLVIGLAASANAFPIVDLWAHSRVDEDWQISQWGEDEEANLVAETKKQAFLHAQRFLELTRRKS